MKKILILFAFIFYSTFFYGQVIDTILFIPKNNAKKIETVCTDLINSTNSFNKKTSGVLFEDPINHTVYLSYSYKELFKKKTVRIIQFGSVIKGSKPGYQHFIVVSNNFAYIINMKHSLSDIFIAIETIPNVPWTKIMEYEKIISYVHKLNWDSEADIKKPYDPNQW